MTHDRQKISVQSQNTGLPTLTAPVHLIFPPLVTSSFGHYYPSMALLDSYLAANGIAAHQEDLNQQFAEFLFRVENLRLLGSGTFPGVPPDSLQAAVARWAARQRPGSLQDPDTGKLKERVYLDNSGILKIIAEPFLIEPSRATFNDEEKVFPWQSLYEQFFLTCGIIEQTSHTALVGISVPMGIQVVPALLLGKLLKRANSSLRLILGGPSISLMDLDDLESLLDRNLYIDACVRFDGEYPLKELARQAIAGEWDPRTVPGVSCRTLRAVRHTPPGPGPNLRTLPAPRYSSLILDRLTSPLLSITQARGCYWGKCDYCDFIELYDGSPPYRGRHPVEFIAELEELMGTYNVAKFAFVTESLPPAFAKKMSTAIIERGLEVRWLSFAMVDRRFDTELLKLMVEAGCDHLVIGLESMVTRTLKLVHKSADREENFRFLRDSKSAGMHLRVNVIPDLPTTTYQEAMQSLADLRELSDCFESVSIFPFEPTRSSNVGRNPESFGFTPISGPPVSGMAQFELNHLQSIDPSMAPEERTDVHQQYNRFEQEINSRIRTPVVDLEAASAGLDDETLRLRFAVEDLDVAVIDGQVVCHHIRTRDRVSLPASPTVAGLLTGESFSRSELSEGAAQQVGFRELVLQGFLVKAD
jgi:hypothetical protein